MVRFFRFVLAWLANGLALALALMVMFGAVAEVGEGAELGSRSGVVVSGVVAWLAVGFLLGTLSYRYQESRSHEVFVDKSTRGLNAVLMLLVVACAARVLAELIPGLREIGLLGVLDRVFGTAWAATTDVAVKLGAPAEVASMPTGPVVLGIVGILGRNAVNWALRQLHLRTKDDGVVLPESRQRSQEEKNADLERRRQAISRRVAIASYTESKALLDSTKRHLTFLALDVVGSTKMKAGEDEAAVEKSFSKYRALVESKLREQEVYKQSWTPDGQLAAFRSAQEAVDCGRAILRALPEFNRNVSEMSAEFHLRLGAHCGTVSVDDQISMEELSDFSIEVAGQMEKQADADSMWISEEVHENLVDSSGFRSSGEIVGGQKVFVWRRAP